MKKAARISGRCFWNLRGIALTGVLALIALPSFAAPFAYVTEAFSSSVRVIDTATNTEIATLATSRNNKIAVHPSGEFVYVPVGRGGWSLGSLDVYDTSNNSLVATIPVGVTPSDVMVHPSGDYVYVVNASAQVPGSSGPAVISVVNTNTNAVSATVEIAHRLTEIAMHPSGNILYAGVAVNGTITAINTNTLQSIDTFNVGGPNVKDLAVHPSGQYLYATSGWNLLVIDTGTNSVVDSIALNGTLYNIAIHPDGNTIYIAGADGGSYAVYAVDTNTNTLSASVTLPGLMGVFDLAVHPSGNFVYVPGYTIGDGPEGQVWVIDTASNQITDTINVAANEGSPQGLPNFITIGPLLESVGGAATGISAISVTCTNSTSGQSVLIGLGNEKAWDCESSGLQVNSGDSIEMVVTGNAN